MRLQFLGANRQVTGSRYLLEAGGLRILIDCGLFQERAMQGRNWEAPMVDPDSIDLMVLTHAHLDHTGLTPRLVAAGYDKPIFATEPTVDLAKIVMLDSAHIHEEDARYKTKRHRKEGRRGPHPNVPLYTREDAEKAAGLLTPVRYHQPRQLNDQVQLTFHEAGHILGSAVLLFEISENGQTTRVLFSGDLGQHNKPFINDPAMLAGADYVVMESTYGDRNHRDAGQPQDQLADLINETTSRGGAVVIPTFAIERAQELMYYISTLVHDDRIPDIPIYLDSPMAVDVTDVFVKYRDYWDEVTRRLFESGRSPLRYPGLKLVRSVDESKQINASHGPMIIMASSGMCTGGRIKHHLKRHITQSQSTIIFVGYQAQGTLGRLIIEGRDRVRIHGQERPVRAKIAQIHGFSAHGDRDDLLNWCAAFERTPKQMFLTHGEESAALALAKTIREKMNWNVSAPHFGDSVELSH